MEVETMDEARKPEAAPAAPARSKSRNVNAYVKRARKARALAARYERLHARCVPVREAEQRARADATLAYAKLTGAQQAEAQRLLLDTSSTGGRT